MVLLWRVAPGPLAHAHKVGPAPCVGQDRSRGQVVEQNGVGALEPVDGLERQQVRIARTRGHEGHEAGHYVSVPGDEVKERAGDVISGRAGFRHRVAIGIRHLRQRCVGLVEDGGIVKLMPAQGCTCIEPWHRGRERRTAVSKVELALFIGGDEAQQPGHFVARAVLVDQRLAERHVSAAFAVDRLCLGVFAQGGAEPRGGGQFASVQFGIAAGQPDEIGIGVGRFIGEGREGQDLGPGGVPAFQQVRIGKAEGGVAGDGDALRRGAGQRGGRGQRRAAGGAFDRIQIDILAQEVGIAGDGGVEVRVFDRLDQPQVAFGQGQVAAPGQDAQHGQPGAVHPQPGQPFVAGRGAAIQDDAGKGQVGHVLPEPESCGGGGLRLAAHVEHQHHWPAHGLRRFRT